MGGQKERFAKRNFHKSYAKNASYIKDTIVNLVHVIKTAATFVKSIENK